MAVVIQRNLGLLILAIWLILDGLSSLVALGLPAAVMGVLALIAGVLILAGSLAAAAKRQKGAATRTAPLSVAGLKACATDCNCRQA